MPLLLLLLFILLPLAEIAVLIKVSELISLGPTLLLLVITAAIGVTLLRQQSLSSLNRVQQALAAGRLPLDAAINAAGLLVAGALLLTPGLITDSIGFALLVPQVRRRIARYLYSLVVKSPNVRIDVAGMHKYRRGTDRSQRPPFGGAPDAPAGTGGPIIEGEIIEPDAVDDSGDSGRSPRRR